MITILLASLLAVLPEVVIADEHPEGGDPTEIKVTLANRTEKTIIVSFGERWHTHWFKFTLFDEPGRAWGCQRRGGLGAGGSRELVRIKPGDTISGYLSPTWDYEIPAGRYQISVGYLHEVPGKDV